MEHAILIVDMPESINGETPCKHCSLHVAEYDDYYHHYVCQGIKTVDGDEWEIYNKCPLKPLVDAIPTEWIKKKSMEFLMNRNFRWATDFQEVIDMWKIENNIPLFDGELKITWEKRK